MSKIAFISDIHGNYPALTAVLNDIDKRRIDKIICLGDLVGYYSMINEVIDTIRERGIPAILGNHDHAMIFNNGIIERSKTCTSILQKQLSYITSKNLEYLHDLPVSLITENNSKTFFCVHGGLNDNVDEYLFKIDEAYVKEHSFQYDFLVTGHTHKFIHNCLSKVTHINPGSVGQPRDGDKRASYVVMDKNSVNHIRVEYDIDRITGDMRLHKFDEYIYSGLYSGKKIGDNLSA